MKSLCDASMIEETKTKLIEVNGSQMRDLKDSSQPVGRQKSEKFGAPSFK